MKKNNSPVYMGIDPGKKGAIAVLSEDYKIKFVWEYPGEIVYCVNLFDKIMEMFPRITLCVIEQQQSVFGGGAGKASFSLGENYGMWQAIITQERIPLVLIKPNIWMKKCIDYGKRKKVDTKVRSREMAQRLFPDLDFSRKKDDGRSDALHIARYAIMYQKGDK